MSYCNLRPCIKCTYYPSSLESSASSMSSSSCSSNSGGANLSNSVPYIPLRSVMTSIRELKDLLSSTNAHDTKWHGLDFTVHNYVEVSRQPALETLEKDLLLTMLKAVGKHQGDNQLRGRAASSAPAIEEAPRSDFSLFSMPPRVRLSIRTEN